MRPRYILIAGILGAASAGCGEEFLSNGLRNFVVSPYQATDEHVLECRSALWADEAWHHLCPENADQKYSLDFKEGFKSGFVTYVTRGGDGNPPAVPPIRYREFGAATVPGARNEKAIEWFAGYRVGAAQAQKSGYRQDVVIAISSPPVNAVENRPTLAENAAANPLTSDPTQTLPLPTPPGPMPPPPDARPASDTIRPRPGPAPIPSTLPALPLGPSPRPISPTADKSVTPASHTEPQHWWWPDWSPNPIPRPMSQAPGGQAAAAAGVGAAAADGPASTMNRRATAPLSPYTSQALPLPRAPDEKSPTTCPRPGPKLIPPIVPPLAPTAPPRPTGPAPDSKVTPASYTEAQLAPSALPASPPNPAPRPIGQAPDTQVTTAAFVGAAAADGPACATGACNPWWGCLKNYFTLEKPPRIQYKTICSKPVCAPCDMVGYGYYPTCWRRWPYPPNCSYCPTPPPGMLIGQPPPPEGGDEELPPPKIYSPDK